LIFFPGRDNIDRMIRLEETTAPVKPGRMRELVRSIFSPGGYLVSALGLQHRPEQARMAEMVGQHLEIDQPLLFEAGTGVGKSLAYLIPGIIWSIDQRRKLIVSTHTILLQDQILRKDLNICRALFEGVPELAAYTEFRAALLVGRSNYVCPRRLNPSMAMQGEMFEDTKSADLDRLRQWAASTVEGRREEINPPVHGELWDIVNADNDACTRAICKKNNCFFHRARLAFETSHVAIVNHSLLLTLLQAQNANGGDEEKAPGILVPNGFAVLDEAHTLPEVATEHLGSALSALGFQRTLKRLYNPEKGKGLLTKRGSDAAKNAIMHCLSEVDDFFYAVANYLGDKRPHLRLLKPDWVEGTLLLALRQCLKTLTAELEGEKESELGKEISTYVNRLQTLQFTLQMFLELPELDKWVYWIEKKGGRRGQAFYYLQSAPIDVAPSLQSLLFSSESACVLTSATLAVGDGMRNFKRTIGAGTATAEIVNSPFKYDEQMEIWVAEDAPAPVTQQGSPAARKRVEYLSEIIPFLTGAEPGGTLALFTSYREMLEVAELIRLNGSVDRLFLVHEAGRSRQELISEFRAAGDALLFGVDSFWTGLDLPGKMLSQVIITRVPFRPHDRPVGKAREEAARQRGESPFLTLALPEALMRLRQGVGRLIRGPEDSGRIILLDPRFLTQNYGRSALGVLPRKTYSTFKGTRPESIYR
jgi:ATP-dependent DNA helicase DinG